MYSLKTKTKERHKTEISHTGANMWLPFYVILQTALDLFVYANEIWVDLFLS